MAISVREGERTLMRKRVGETRVKRGGSGDGEGCVISFETFLFARIQK